MKRLLVLLLLVPSLAVAQNFTAQEGAPLPHSAAVMGCDNGTTTGLLQCDANGVLTVSSSSSSASGTAITVSVTPAVDTAAYASGDYINDGDAITSLASICQTSGCGLTIDTIVFADEGAEAVDLEAWFFNANPSGSTFTDNAAFAVADADLGKVCCVTPIVDHYAANDNGVSVANPDCECDLSTGTTLYMALVARGAVTFDAADAVTVNVTATER